MHMLSQMDPDLYREVLRKQTEAWDALIAAFATTWDRLFELRRAPENRVSIEDVLADLTYGRD
ncbi:MAG: hypothetical protein JRG93_14190 [Deltaproteobacteria bacterium]|nr:hypothetical protein [Deltaproteobacteria bacterium]MBW2190713.1 hypothetical protein [Deltaproteobacteria bacterium]MBW2224702.1 hypothetical protein [Deltaproteobacteria bacterium]MBW2405029.1 hypothetical protein [Deltaproteobacteria bacterium]MBW2548476.1 hypothetical protein [Deltaproteobacteria bacterium]